MKRHFRRRGVHFRIAGLLAPLTNCAFAEPVAGTVICHTPSSEGAAVDSAARCSMFKHFGFENAPPDERIARNLHVARGGFARSIALVVGISKYLNPAYDLPAARIDVGNLKKFLIDDQKFDEVIVLRDQTQQ